MIAPNARAGTHFAWRAARDLRVLMGGETTTGGDLRRHLDGALEWLCHAQDRTRVGGVSYGYSLRGGWRPPYPETSGYICSTFLRAGRLLQRGDLITRGLLIADWLLRVQRPDGSFANPAYGDEGIVFDTGQDIFGLVAAYEVSERDDFLLAAARAADWLTLVADVNGRWTRSEHLGVAHVYNTRTAWALLRVHEYCNGPRYERIARVNLEWALSRQGCSGFFSDNAFRRGRTPYLHNISYAICGLQESGWLLNEDRYVRSARRCLDATVALMRTDGALPGQVSAAGAPTTWYSCLTGQSQVAVALARHGSHTGDDSLRELSAAALTYVLAHQRLSDGPAPLRGAVPGSFPVWGRYAPLSAPNWATKFTADACLEHLEPRGGSAATLAG